MTSHAQVSPCASYSRAVGQATRAKGCGWPLCAPRRSRRRLASCLATSAALAAISSCCAAAFSAWRASVAACSAAAAKSMAGRTSWAAPMAANAFAGAEGPAAAAASASDRVRSRSAAARLSPCFELISSSNYSAHSARVVRVLVKFSCSLSRVGRHSRAHQRRAYTPCFEPVLKPICLTSGDALKAASASPSRDGSSSHSNIRPSNNQICLHSAEGQRRFRVYLELGLTSFEFRC